MDISKEHFREIIEKYRESDIRSNRRTSAVMIILRLLGLGFIVGAVIIVFSLPVGVIVCACAALLFIALYYIEIHSENKHQIAHYHMILTKSSFAAASKYRSEGCTDSAVEQLISVLDTETDPRRKAVLGEMLCEAHILRGEKCEAAPIDDALSDEDSFFGLLSVYLEMRDNILSGESSSKAYTIASEYDSIEELIGKNSSLIDDPMTARLIIKAEILSAFFKEDYCRCAEYIDTLLICPDIFGEDDSPAACGYILLKIRCLYYIGKYDEARRLCDDIMPKLTEFPYLNGQAKELWKLLN